MHAHRNDPEQTGDRRAASSRVIKAFNAMYARAIAADPVHGAGRQVVPYAGDDLEAKRLFDETISGFGFAPVDMGPLREGGRLTQIDGGPLSGLHLLRQS
jgi:predicted dinucleotide-binding enzyme